MADPRALLAQALATAKAGEHAAARTLAFTALAATLPDHARHEAAAALRLAGEAGMAACFAADAPPPPFVAHIQAGNSLYAPADVLALAARGERLHGRLAEALFLIEAGAIRAASGAYLQAERAAGL